MVIRSPSRSPRERGLLTADLLVAIALLVGALLPIAYSIASEKRLARACYEHAVAMEIVDGEFEALLAGGWHALPAGTHEYIVQAGAMTNLPPGKFVATVELNRLRLEWRPAAKDHGGAVAREAALK